MTQEQRRKIYGIMKCPFVVDEVTQEESGMVLGMGNGGTMEWITPTTEQGISMSDLDDMWGVTDTTPWDNIMNNDI